MAVVEIAKGTERVASDGNKYRWIGSQWGKVTRTNKVGQMARRAIGAELTKAQ